MPFKKLLRDPFKQLLFELGAGYYARKLATGPEADIRQTSRPAHPAMVISQA